MKTIVAVIFLSCVVAVFGDDGGSIQEIDVNDRFVQLAAKKATVTLTQMKNSPNHQKLVQVKSAKFQVVAGVLYHLEVEIQDSGCLKSAAFKFSPSLGSRCWRSSENQDAIPSIIDSDHSNSFLFRALPLNAVSFGYSFE